MKKNNIFISAMGILTGFVNGLLGAGGGMIAVPSLKKAGLEQKKAHANAVAVILPITLLSAILYISKGYVNLSDAYIYMPTGVIGAVIGSYILIFGIILSHRLPFRYIDELIRFHILTSL